MTGFAQNIPKKILNGVSFNIHQWEIYGFLGLNGAGKTTTLETIMGFHQPDSGQIHFFWKHIFNSYQYWDTLSYLIYPCQILYNLFLKKLYFNKKKSFLKVITISFYGPVLYIPYFRAS